MLLHSMLLHSMLLHSMMLQLVPLQLPQATEHVNPCFLQVHFLVSQLTLQLQRVIFNNLSGAAGESI